MKFRRYIWIAALWCVAAISVNAQNYFVATNGSDAAAGTSWDAPFLTISNAIAVASPGQTVAVSNGTYVLATQLLLDKGITLQGFGGASNTVIDANGSSSSNRVIIISSASAVLDGFTVRNGFLNSSGQYGAGINISAGEVRNCIVMNNTNNLGFTVSNGGGIYMSGGVLSSSIVRNNYLYSSYAACKGGGVYVGGGAVVTNCTILGNLIDGVDPITRGGGVYIDTGSVVDCTIVSNNAAFRWSYTGYGGGVYLAGAGAVLDRSVLSGNQVSRLSGGLTTNGFGGGIAMTNGTVRNCLISGNESANTAGGAYVSGGTLENCTVVRNKGIVNFGGVYWTNSPAILNDIVYDNSGGLESNILAVVAGLTNVTYSCAPSLTNGTGNVTADPLFVNPGIGSGLTFTAGDYRPVEGSPCETNGLVSGWMSTALDLAGLPRLNGSKVDMGCYRVIPPSSAYVATTGNDGNAGTNWSAPFLTIQKGIDASTTLGTVFVSNGTYVLTSQLLLSKGCTVVGVGGASNTVIDANGSNRVITISSASAVLDGFTLRSGYITGSQNGAGINMSAGEVRNCIVMNNTNNLSTVSGGGIYMSGGILSSTMVRDNYLKPGNSATAKGGGVYVSGGAVVTNCTISGNLIDGDDPNSYGGGVYIVVGRVVDSIISSNNAAKRWGNKTSYGGGAYLENTASLLDRCVVYANQVSQPAGQPTGRFGGGIAMTAGTIRNCLVSGNECVDDAGGVYMTGGTNENCTIVRNKASVNYGGVYWTNSPTIRNVIAYNNSGAVENDILPVYLGLTNVTYSCAPSLSVGTGNVTADPMFTASGSGNGITFTPGDYRLVKESPCMNKGYTEVWMRTAIDLDRLQRYKGGNVDMGAYELQRDTGTTILFR